MTASERQITLEGRWALVTGAARRIGAVIARTLHDAGANVAIHYHRSADDAERLARLPALSDPQMVNELRTHLTSASAPTMW